MGCEQKSFVETC